MSCERPRTPELFSKLARSVMPAGAVQRWSVLTFDQAWAPASRRRVSAVSK